MFFGDKRRQEVSEDEIRTMVSDNEELDDEEKRMIHEVMDLSLIHIFHCGKWWCRAVVAWREA